MPSPNRAGITYIPVILLLAAVLMIIAFLFSRYPDLFKNLIPVPSLSPQATASATPTPSPTASPRPTASPSPKASATPTAKPATPTPTAVPVSGPPGSGYSRITVATEKGNFVASVLSLDLGNTRVITDTANDSDCANDCPVLPLADFVTRNGGFAGVNGTYFCPATYPECAGKTNSFDFPVYNSRLNKWINDGKFYNSRAMVYFRGNQGFYHQQAVHEDGITAGIVNHPGLLENGNVQIDDNQSGLSDKQKSVGTKVGIGLRGASNVLVVVASSVNMQQFAYVFKALGATYALNLDTGGSTALWYGGYKFGPGRNIPNAIIFAR